MKKTLLQAFKVDRTYKTNSFLYKLRKLKIISYLIPSEIYQYTEAKMICSTFLEIVRFIFDIICKFGYLYLIVYLPVSGITYLTQPTAYIISFITLSVFIGPLMKPIIIEQTMKKYICIKLINMNAKEYAISDFFYSLIRLIITFIPGIIIMGFIVKVPLWQSILLLIALVATRIIGSMLDLYYFNRTNKNRYRNYYLTYGLVLLMIAIGAGVILLNPELNLLFIIPLLIVVPLSILSLSYIIKNKTYKILYNKILIKEEIILDTAQMTKKSEIDMVKMRDKDIQIELTDSKKTGYEYFNELFYKRHRHVLMSAVIKITIVLAIISVGACVILLFTPKSISKTTDITKYILPYIVFLMYALNRGQVICRAWFYNCDHSMLTYQFYKTKKNTLDNFIVRLKTVVKLNLLPAIVISAGLTAFLLIANVDISPTIYITLVTSIICLSIFFSVHNLVIYYLLQPYDINMENKSTMYNIVNMVTYFVCYTCMNIRVSTSIFALAIIILTCTYISVALYITYRYAPTTFKLK